MLPQPSVGQTRWEGRAGLALVALLSLLAGATDAIAFAATDNFVSFMSGNTTRLGIALASAQHAQALTLAALLVAFVSGNSAGVVLAKLARQRCWPVLGAVACLLGLGSACQEPFAALLLAAGAMGLLNVVVEQVNGLPFGLTYVTGALSRFGRGLGRWLCGERSRGWRVQLVPWGGLLAGATLGALLQAKLGLPALGAAGGLALAIAVLTFGLPLAWQQAYRPQ